MNLKDIPEIFEVTVSGVKTQIIRSLEPSSLAKRIENNVHGQDRSSVVGRRGHHPSTSPLNWGSVKQSPTPPIEAENRPKIANISENFFKTVASPKFFYNGTFNVDLLYCSIKTLRIFEDIVFVFFWKL